MKSILLASCLTLAVLPMCKPDPAQTNAETTAADPSSPAEVRTQLTILRDSADTIWQRMLTSDDQKLRDLRNLLGDLNKVPGLDQTRLGSLRQATNRLQGQRYTRQSMASSLLIDRYDAAQDSVLKVALPLAAPDGNAPTAPVRDYVEHIQAADAAVVAYRVRYDRAAKAYNAYLRVHGAALTKLGGRYTQLQPLPLFELSQ